MFCFDSVLLPCGLAAPLVVMQAARQPMLHRTQARLLAAKVCLGSMSGDHAVAVSATQAAAVVELAKEAELSKWTAADKSSVIDAVVDVPWIGAD